jgi:hypothetical protein
VISRRLLTGAAVGGLVLAASGGAVKASLRANGSRERAPDDRLREASQKLHQERMDCFVALLLAMTRNSYLPTVYGPPFSSARLYAGRA